MDTIYDTIMDDDGIDDPETIKPLTKRNWINSTASSMAHLKKVSKKPNVYSMGIVNATDLRPINLRTRQAQENGNAKPDRVTRTSDGNVMTVTAFPPPDKAVKPCSNFKGSNQSIPDLMNQYNSANQPSQKPQRPASAKHTTRTRPSSGRRVRPQSAKETSSSPSTTSEDSTPILGGEKPICRHGTYDDRYLSVRGRRVNKLTAMVNYKVFERAGEKIMLVRGAKYDPNGRPPKGMNPGGVCVGWVGPPGGIKYPDRPANGKSWMMEFPLQARPDSVTTQPGTSSAPPPSPVPPSPTPEPPKMRRHFDLYLGNFANENDDGLESSDDGNADPNYPYSAVNHYVDSAPNPPISRESTNELKLSLPTADEEEFEQMDTERLLAEAEEVANQFDLKNIIKSNTQKQSPPFSTLNSPCYDDGEELSPKKKAEELVSEIIMDSGLEFNKGNDSPLSQQEGKGVKFSDNVTTFSITPRNIGRKVDDLHPNKKKGSADTGSGVEMKHRSVTSAPKQERVGWDGKELSPRAKTKMGISNVAKTGGKKQSPRNTVKVSGIHYTDTVQPHTSLQSKKGKTDYAPHNRVQKHVANVTLDYSSTVSSLDGADRQLDDVKQTKKARGRKDVDVVTMMQRLSFDEESDIDPNLIHLDEQTNIKMSELLKAPTVYKSDPVKNYYEVSRKATTTLKEEKNEQKPSDQRPSSSNTVYKSTKTIDFDELEKLGKFANKNTPSQTGTHTEITTKPPRPSSAKSSTSKKSVEITTGTAEIERSNSRQRSASVATTHTDESRQKSASNERPLSPSEEKPKSAENIDEGPGVSKMSEESDDSSDPVRPSSRRGFVCKKKPTLDKPSPRDKPSARDKLTPEDNGPTSASSRRKRSEEYTNSYNESMEKVMAKREKQYHQVLEEQKRETMKVQKELQERDIESENLKRMLDESERKNENIRNSLENSFELDTDQSLDLSDESHSYKLAVESVQKMDEDEKEKIRRGSSLYKQIVDECEKKGREDRMSESSLGKRRESQEEKKPQGLPKWKKAELKLEEKLTKVINRGVKNEEGILEEKVSVGVLTEHVADVGELANARTEYTPPTWKQVAKKVMSTQIVDQSSDGLDGERAKIKTFREVAERAMSLEAKEQAIDNLLNRTKLPQSSSSAKQSSSNTSSYRKGRRPASASVGSANSRANTGKSRRPISATAGNQTREKREKNGHYSQYSRTSAKTKLPPKKKDRAVYIQSNTPYYEPEETKEDVHCQKMEQQLAEKGVKISASTLQRALYPPTGRTKYYQITADLPKRATDSLLSHPSVWLPEEYDVLMRAKTNLANANRAMRLQNMEGSNLGEKKTGRTGRKKMKTKSATSINKVLTRRSKTPN